MNRSEQVSQGIRIRAGEAADEPALLQLLPRLAEFELSPRRKAEHLWQGDAELVSAYYRGEAEHCQLWVAEGTTASGQRAIAGLALVSLQPEFTSHEPGAHLEALAVAPEFEGRGVGRELIAAAESGARAAGAESMTLHVFNSNQRAHGLYEALGYQSEIQRCIKWFDVD